MSDTPSLPPVLIVDDNESSAQMLAWALEMFGAQAHIAHSGKQAIELAERHQPVMVLMDIGLPDMDGYETCRRLRADGRFDQTLFIAQTGWGEAEHKQRSAEAGFDHHLVKPVDLEEIRKLFETRPVKQYA